MVPHPFILAPKLTHPQLIKNESVRNLVEAPLPVAPKRRVRVKKHTFAPPLLCFGTRGPQRQAAQETCPWRCGGKMALRDHLYIQKIIQPYRI